MLLLKQKGHRLKGVLPRVELACKAVLCIMFERCIMISARRAPYRWSVSSNEKQMAFYNGFIEHSPGQQTFACVVSFVSKQVKVKRNIAWIGL